MIELDRDPIFNETEENLKRLGIEAVLFDLDDTLIFTAELFSRYMEEYVDVVSKRIGVEKSLLLKALQDINDEEYKTMGVNPKRWASVAERLAKQFIGGEKEILDNLDILMKIYSDEPRLRNGVRGMLEVLKGLDMKMVLVTHANVDWTNFKLESLQLWDYFDTVVIVDENGHKNSLDWRKGMDSICVLPEKCLVVGDSLGGDIRPGDDLGARTMWMPSPWSVYRQGEVPEKTVIIDEIADLLAALGRLR